MEDRVVPSHRAAERPSPALIALLSILAITAAWWALAFWPAGAAEPEWLSRTRAACFGSAPGGLPDAGGWVLLIGEPIGMLGVLAAVWGRTLRRDLERVRAVRRWRLAAAGIAAATLIAMIALGVRVERAWARGHPPALSGPGIPMRLDLAPPSTALVDQQGTRMSLADLRGQPARRRTARRSGHSRGSTAAGTSGSAAHRCRGANPRRRRRGPARPGGSAERSGRSRHNRPHRPVSRPRSRQGALQRSRPPQRPPGELPDRPCGP